MSVAKNVRSVVSLSWSRHAPAASPAATQYHVHVSRATPYSSALLNWLVLQTNANNGNRAKCVAFVRAQETHVFLQPSAHARSVIPKTQPVETSGTQIKVITFFSITIFPISDNVREIHFAFVLWWCEKCVRVAVIGTEKFGKNEK